MTDAETEHTFIHGPKVTRVSDECDDCNYDTHTCPGCGEWLYHGTGVCGPCLKDVAEDEAQEVAKRDIRVGDRVRIIGVTLNDQLEIGTEGWANTHGWVTWNDPNGLSQVGVVLDGSRQVWLLPSDPFIVVLP